MQIQPGTVFRKLGPIGWFGIERILMPGFPGYDGGMPGVVFSTTMKRSSDGKVGWKHRGFWQADSPESLVKILQAHGLYPIDSPLLDIPGVPKEPLESVPSFNPRLRLGRGKGVQEALRGRSGCEEMPLP